MLSKTFIFSVGIILAVSAFHHPIPRAKNTAEDAANQVDAALSCWEPSPDGGYRLSEPIYSLCSYMPDPFSYDKFGVNGVNPNSDDYTPMISFFAENTRQFSVINLCLQEAFQFHIPTSPSQVSLRCLCKRSGCNIPKNITEFLDFNKKPMPTFEF